MDNRLVYDLRSDGVLYSLGGSINALVKRKSPTRVRIEMWKEDVLLAPETGDLGTSSFRTRLVELAGERFGEVNGLAEELGLIAAAFDEHSREREEAASEDDEQTNDPALVGTPYRVVDGGVVRLKNTREGEIPQRLTNFTARVEEEVVRDDGADVRRIYKITGNSREKTLPRAEVPAAQFGGMNWVSDVWGLSARITAGQGARDYTREAIELLSQEATSRRLYAHTGWRELPTGERAYLHAAGATGADDVEVELEPGLERYALPSAQCTQEELAEAVRVSLALAEMAPRRITAPLLGALYLAPLSEIVVPDFVLWLWGGTGAFKSTIAALALSHYGDFSETNLPLSFESTANALERSLFLLKDVPAVVDDWRPAVSRGDASEMDRKAQRLLRAAGNRQGRGRMTSDTTLRRSYSPRGMVIATAEALPEGPAFESAAARSLSINLSRGDVDLTKLSELQRDKGLLSQAMARYIDFLISQYDLLCRELPAYQSQLREKARQALGDSHPRTPDAAASLSLGLVMLKKYAVTVGGLSREEADEFLVRSEAGVIEAARAHAETTSDGDPATRFIEILGSLFDGGGAYAKDRETGADPEDWADLGWERRQVQDGTDIIPERGASFVGWVDENHFYLDKDAAYAAVSSFAQRGGIPFGIKPGALWKALARSGVSLVGPGRTDTVVRVEGRTRRAMQVPRATVLGGAKGDG